MKNIQIRSSFREADKGSKGNKFKVVLIEEGLGNFQSAFYYTKECLQEAASLFEGKKCLADHPTTTEEQTRPERSVRDILGYYEDVTYVEVDGRGMLEANLCVEPVEWAVSLLTNSLEYAKKYKDKDFVGLSINANGEAQPTDLDEFMKTFDIPESAIPKLLEAKQMGVTQIQVVGALKDAISCDLVTEAGAGGKILSMIESKRGKAMKLKTKEAGKVPSSPGKSGPLPVKGQEEGAPPMAPSKDGDGHDDEGQDKALFAKMIKQYLGDDAEADEESMKMAQHAYEAHKEDGMDHEAAYEAAGKHLKMAMAIGKKMSQGETEAEEAGDPDADGKPMPAKKPAPAQSHDDAESEAESEAEAEAMKQKKKESAHGCHGCIEKAAQLSKLKESLRVNELNQYLEKKCIESKLPVKVTKEARAILGVPKSKEHINTVLETFKRVHLSALEDAGVDSWFQPEKTAFVESDAKDEKISFADCMSS